MFAVNTKQLVNAALRGVSAQSHLPFHNAPESILSKIGLIDQRAFSTKASEQAEPLESSRANRILSMVRELKSVSLPKTSELQVVKPAVPSWSFIPEQLDEAGRGYGPNILRSGLPITTGANLKSGVELVTSFRDQFLNSNYEIYRSDRHLHVKQYDLNEQLDLPFEAVRWIVNTIKERRAVDGATAGSGGHPDRLRGVFDDQVVELVFETLGEGAKLLSDETQEVVFIFNLTRIQMNPEPSRQMSYFRSEPLKDSDRFVDKWVNAFQNALH